MIRRETKQREAILNVVRNSDSHPTADWIYDQVRKVIPNISKGTVYRNLRILLEDGKISDLKLEGSVGRYEGNQNNHYHFLCERCGRIFDLDEPVDHSIEYRVASKTGFKVKGHHLELIGLCPDCQ